MNLGQHAPRRPIRVAGFSFADGGGGAAKAASRLHMSLCQHGVDATLHVLRKTSSDPSVLDVAASARFGALATELAPRIDQLPIRLLHPRAKSFWSTGWYGSVDPLELPGVPASDVICLYWVTRGFLGISQIGRLLATGKPVVWRLSDMWPFTGGCHYSGDCDGFLRNCGACPQLASRGEYDLSRRLQKSKVRHWTGGNLTVVSPSRWMADKARASSLFHARDVRVIPTGVDCDKFRPSDRGEAREALGLPRDGKLVLYGATSALTDPRKGGDVAARLFSLLPSPVDGKPAPGLVIFGSDQRPAGIPDTVPVYPLGVIRDEMVLAKVYSACDVFIAPSREENLANSVLEAMACGMPALAFNVGGMPDAILHGRSGLLFEPGDEIGFAKGLAWLLGDSETLRGFSSAARDRAENVFSQARQVTAYLGLYSELCE